MTRAVALAIVLLGSLAAAPTAALAQSVQDRASALNAVIQAESEAGMDEFAKLETDQASQDAVCTHLSVGIRHMITANENANALISLLQAAQEWEAYDRAHAVGLKTSTTANRAIDEYNRQCESWVEPAERH